VISVSTLYNMDPLTIFKNRIQQYDNGIIPNLRKLISYNPKITIEMVVQDIQNNPSKRHEWQFHLLCRHIHIKDLLAHGILPRPSDINDFSQVMKIDIQTLIQMKDTENWDWEKLTMNKNFTMDDIASHPELPWEYSMLLGKPNIKLHSYANQFHPLVLQYGSGNIFNLLSASATYNDIKNYPDKHWTYRCLESPNITDKAHLQELWHRFKDKSPYAPHTLVENPSLTFEDHKELLPHDKQDFYPIVSNSPNITQQHILDNPNENWCFSALGRHLPMEYILSHKEHPWVWSSIYRWNKTLTYEIIRKIIPKKTFMTDASLLFYNEHFSYSDKKHLYEDILFNHYLKSKNVRPDYLIDSPFFLEPTFEEIKYYFAGKRIIRCVVECMSNPVYKQCRKRLMKEYHNAGLVCSP